MENEYVRRTRGFDPSAYDRSTLAGTGSLVPAVPVFRERLSTIELDPRLKSSDEDRLAYKAFLEQPGTGFLKLLTRPKCEAIESEAERDNCIRRELKVPFYWGTFLFQRKVYVNSRADLTLLDDKLMGAGLALQTIMVELGDVPLQDLALSSEGLKYLNEFVPEPKADDAQKQFDLIKKGIVTNKYRYWPSLWARVNSSYALRSIAYDTRQIAANVGSEGDLTIVFRIIRRDPDGSITLLWKELQRKKAPALKP